MIGLDGGRSVLFLVVERFAFTFAFYFEALPLVEDKLFLSDQYIIPIWVKPGKFCATFSLDAALWRFIAKSVDVPDSSRRGGVIS